MFHQLNLLATSNVHCKVKALADGCRVAVILASESRALVEPVDGRLAVRHALTPLLLLLRTESEVEQSDTVVETDLQLGSFLPFLHKSTETHQTVSTSATAAKEVVIDVVRIFIYSYNQQLITCSNSGIK